MPRETEKQLIALCLQGDEQAYWKLVKRFKDRLFNVAYLMLHNGDEAEDIVQDTFVRMYRNLAKFRQQSSLYTWLYRITVNLACNRLRSTSRKRSTSLNTLTDEKKYFAVLKDNRTSIEKAFLKKETRDAVSTAIDTLSAKLKEVIILRYHENMDYKQISILLKVNIGTVKSRLFSAREILKSRLNLDELLTESEKV